MGGDPFTLVEQFDRTRGDPRLDRLAREAIREGLSGFPCAAGRLIIRPAMALMKRSPKITANCAFAMVHSRGGIFHSFSDRFKIR